jgi:lipopolysaccharide transport system ATP-binding protein
MSSENSLALSVSGLSKCYRLYSAPQDRLKQFLFGRWRPYYNEFWALRDLSFQIERGSSVGIIGRNGAGKSTLLQLLVGTLSPTAGEIHRTGRVAALLELGTGFNPDFSGHENIFLNGRILGLSQKEIEAKYEEIVAFADIGDFIWQPVKTYSSGMFVRLAFAVAITVDPDILIVDEALSVGDVKFQAKCFRKFEEFRRKKKTILFVTHATEQILRHCDSALLIEGGRIMKQGAPKEVVYEYLNLLFGNNPQEISNQGEREDLRELVQNLERVSREEILDRVHERPGYNRAEYRWGNREAEIVDITVSNDTHTGINHFDAHERVHVDVTVRFDRDVEQPIYGFAIKTAEGTTIYSTNSRDAGPRPAFIPRKAGDVVVIRFSGRLALFAGNFLLSCGVVDQVSDELVVLDRRYDVIEIQVKSTARSTGLADLQMSVLQLSAESVVPEAKGVVNAI